MSLAVKCDCPFCATVDEGWAGRLLAVGGHYVRLSRRLILVETGNSLRPEHVERAALAINFYRSPAVIRFRAFVEGWDLQRISEEVASCRH